MAVCYEYSGIGQMIMEMSVSDWAQWFGAIGTVTAALTAVWIYQRTRADAKADAATKRRVLLGMLREHAVMAVMDLEQNIVTLQGFVDSGLSEDVTINFTGMIKQESP